MSINQVMELSRQGNPGQLNYQVEQMIKALGGTKQWDLVIQGRKRIKLEDNYPQSDVSYITADGDLILQREKSEGIVLPDPKYGLFKPDLQNYICAKRLQRLQDILGLETVPHEDVFLMKSVSLAAEIYDYEGDWPTIRNILRAPYFPIYQPPPKSLDIGQEALRYVLALGETSKLNVGGFSANPVWTNEASLRVDSAYEDIINSEQAEEGQLGLFFPLALQGYSLDAALRALSELPPGFCLSGYCPLVAGIMYPEVFFRSLDTVHIGMGAFSWRGKRSMQESRTMVMSMNSYKGDQKRILFSWLDLHERPYAFNSIGLSYFA